jgi:hypothetical protein
VILFFFKPPNIFIPHKIINIYKNIIVPIFTKIPPYFLIFIIYKNTIEYEKLLLETIKILSKNNKAIGKEQKIKNYP